MSRKAALTVFAITVLLQLLSVAVVAQLESGSIVSEVMTHSDTSTTLYATTSFFKCISDLHITVTSTAEISSPLQEYATNSTPVKIRATRNGMHSSAGFVCPGRSASTKFEFHDSNHAPPDHYGSPLAINLLLDRMNRVVDVNREAHQLTVEAGMTLLGLLEAAEAHSMSAHAGALSVFANLTVGGVISASAHGAGSSLAELVTKLKWVNAKGEVRVSDVRTDEEGEGLLGGLGLLGVVTEVTLQLEPWSRTEVEVRDDLDDEGLAGELASLVKEETKYVITYWQPELGIYRLILFKPVKEGELDVGVPPLDAKATNVLSLGLPEEVAAAVSDFHAAWGNDVADDSEAADVLNAAGCDAARQVIHVPVFHDSTNRPTSHATLPTNRVPISPDCSPHCFWEPRHVGVGIPATEFSIKRSLFASWIHDVKRIVQSELSEVESRLPGHGKACLPGPFMLRFGSGTSSPISTRTGPDDVVFVQWLPMVSARTPRKPGKHSPVWETIEQLTLCKYHGRPSYGQNHERIFRHPRCHVRENFPEDSFAKVNALQEKHDPGRIFEPELWQHVVSKRGPEYAPLCALSIGATVKQMSIARRGTRVWRRWCFPSTRSAKWSSSGRGWGRGTRNCERSEGRFYFEGFREEAQRLRSSIWVAAEC